MLQYFTLLFFRCSLRFYEANPCKLKRLFSSKFGIFYQLAALKIKRPYSHALLELSSSSSILPAIQLSLLEKAECMLASKNYEQYQVFSFLYPLLNNPTLSKETQNRVLENISNYPVSSHHYFASNAGLLPEFQVKLAERFSSAHISLLFHNTNLCKEALLFLASTSQHEFQVLKKAATLSCLEEVQLKILANKNSDSLHWIAKDSASAKVQFALIDHPKYGVAVATFLVERAFSKEVILKMIEKASLSSDIDILTSKFVASDMVRFSEVQLALFNAFDPHLISQVLNVLSAGVGVCLEVILLLASNPFSYKASLLATICKPTLVQPHVFELLPLSFIKGYLEKELDDYLTPFSLQVKEFVSSMTAWSGSVSEVIAAGVLTSC